MLSCLRISTSRVPGDVLSGYVPLHKWLQAKGGLAPGNPSTASDGRALFAVSVLVVWTAMSLCLGELKHVESSGARIGRHSAAGVGSAPLYR